MNTLKNQNNTNNLITKYLKANNFNVTIKDNIVYVGMIKITTMAEAIKLNKHKDNL